ncbi:MAG: carboxypeptidase regulatory-like domain-containing protein [Oceanospirillaceae bacterium]|nr:carboxypeptidase regulatory-like domain-containing protein [Oceanospirillaceae bacterium]
MGKKVAVGLVISLIAQLILGANAWSQEAKIQNNGAQLSLYVFEENTPTKDFYVWMDKETQLESKQHESNENGAANFRLTPGEHQLSVAKSGFNNAVINLNVAEGEYLQIIVTLYPGNVTPHIAIESSRDGRAKNKSAVTKVMGDPGVLKGKVINSENGEPVEGARLFFSGVATDFVTDKNGEFEADIPSSTYSLSILHNRFASQTLDGIEIKAGKTLEKQFEVTPAGIALKEFVVVAPFIQGSVSSLVDERKETKVVSDFVGAEQMSKSGDSDAAAALTRVAGLTLIDGKYAVIRGMEDRYTTVLMNGAVMRSPDPNSKSVDLDMFPASILDSIEVQKTYSADAPGAFGGGLIKLRTKALPEEDFIKFKISTGGNTNTTGKSVISQESGSQDYLGMDDGDRDIPVSSEPQDNLTESDAEKFPVRYAIKSESANPDLALSLGFGQVTNLGDYKLGYQAYLGYSNKWSYEEGEKNTFAANGDILTPRNDQDYKKSKYSPESTLLLNAAIESKTSQLKSTTSLIRKSYRLTRQDEGIDGENNEYIRKTDLEWSERELFSQQFNGKHDLSESFSLDWVYGFSSASLNNPDRMTYRYDDNISNDTNNLYYYDGETYRDFLELTDDNQTLGFNIFWRTQPVSFMNINIKAGYSFDSINRESQNTVYQISWYDATSMPVDIISNQDINEVLGADNINSNGFIFRNATSPSDGYDANTETTGMYVSFETTWFDSLDIILGARSESFSQEVNTFDSINGDPINVSQSTDNMLPSLLVTYRIMNNLQARVAVAETVNRPSMLELSSSLWIDPETGSEIRGNPRLTEAVINHFDARLEFYGNGANSMSLAYFSKNFDAPIEKTLKPSVKEVITFQNAKSATNSGFEFDFRWDLDFIPTGEYLIGMSGNYSIIESEVTLEDGHTEYSDTRSMQGQSPYTMNLMLTLENNPMGFEAALILNEIGERITRVGQGDVPHIYEEPFTALDFTLAKDLDESKVSFKIKNLLDSTRLYTQGGETYQKTKPGISFSAGYSLSF